ncbi:MAG: hypothetical protein ABFD08_08385 [Syntrophomonas sp.]
MISLDEFNNLPEDEKMNMLQNLKNEVGVKEIIEAWGISRSKLYSIQNKLGITSEIKKPRKPKDKKIKVTRSRSPRNPRSEMSSSINTNNEFSSGRLNVESEAQKNTPKFSMALETTGPAALLVDTLQTFLLSERVAHLNLKVNIQIEQV